MSPILFDAGGRRYIAAMAKMLIVDGDEYLEIASKRLADERHQVDTCNNAADVAGKVVSGNYQMLLVDLDLPNLAVGDMLPLLRNLPTFAQTRVILLSNVDTPERRETAKKYECEFLVKTGDGEALAQVVRHSFASKPPGLPPQ